MHPERMMNLSNEVIDTEEQLIARMTTPSPAVVSAVSALDGPVLILGAGGEMGPTLAELLVKAGAEVYGVARFSEPGLAEYLSKVGVKVITMDLMSEEGLDTLPDVPNVLVLVGFKFGSASNPATTWAVNAAIPGRLVERYRDARIVYLSSGNVYPFSSIGSGGSTERDTVGPVGEYAQSRLGGERIAEYTAAKQGTSLLIVRLFYATELRYGIIRDIVDKVSNGAPIDLSTGYVNQIWQGDANSYLARSFPLCSNPAKIINVVGPETLSVRDIAQQVGDLLNVAPRFVESECDTALLGNANSLIHELGFNETSVKQMIQWTVHWVTIGGRSLGKPTKYEKRTGKF